MKLRNFALVVSVRLWLAGSALHTRLAMALGAILCSVAMPARADGDTIFSMFDFVADSAENSGKSTLKLAKFGGIGFVAAGIILWIAKKKNPQIGWGWILTLWGAGFLLIALDQFIKKGQSTIQLNPVDVG